MHVCGFLSVLITDFFMEQVKKKRKFKFPLWAKTLIVLLLSVAAVSVVAVVYSSRYLKKTTMQSYVDKSVQLADTLGVYLNYDEVLAVRDKTKEIYETVVPSDAFVSNDSWGEDIWLTYVHYFDEVVNMVEYQNILKDIEAFHKVNEAKYTYVAYVDWTNERLIYLVDDSPLGEEDPEVPDAPIVDGERCLPGTFDDFTEQDKTVYSHIAEGFSSEVTNMEQYGYLVSVGRPVFKKGEGIDKNDKNNVEFYTLVDLSMDAIIAEQSRSVRTLAWILVILGVAAVIVGYLLVVLFILRPVRKLTKAANEYTEGSGEELDKFAKVKIRTRDEIEDLSNSMKKMEGDINKYIADLLSTSSKLEGAKRKADEMKSLADKDALTGIANKRAYFETEERLNKEIKQGKARFAISMIDLNDLKLTNDTLGHEKGDELIIGLSNIIRETFTSSSLYRIGGDEFAVISENGDLKDIDVLQKKFAEAINKSIKVKDIDGMGVSAAIGFAIFDPNIDNNVEDTFKRADKKMYENKKMMKGSN